MSDVTRSGLRSKVPGRDAMVGVFAGSERRRRRSAEQAMVPDVTFTSYYGKPVLNKPVWEERDIAGYFYLGGLAGASSVLGFGAQLTGRRVLARACKLGAISSLALGMVGLVHDLGKPERFFNMLRVFKPTSPMNVGSWILSGYGPAAGVAAASALTGKLPKLGATASAGAAALGPLVASYTAALISDTAVPAWHEGFREMPFVFVGSAATAAAGLGMLAAPVAEAGPARRAAVFGAACELAASRLLEHRIGPPTAAPYHQGKSGTKMRVAQAMTLAGTVGGLLLGRKSRGAAAACGATLLAASALTRFAIFEAGIASAEDPRHTIVPQRERVEQRKRQQGLDQGK